MTIGTFAYAFSGTTGAVINLRMVPNGYTPAAGEFVILADVLPSPNLAAVRKFTDWYWIVNDTNPTTQVWSTASNAYVANTAAAFLTWLSANNSQANPPGSAFPIHGMANNGVGLIRVQLGSTAALQTGQQFNVSGQTGQAAATGNWVITVIDATHIDLQASTFNAGDPWVTGGMVQGASIIDTSLNLSVAFNTVTLASWTVSQVSQSSATNIQLTNPCPAFNSCSISAAGHSVILPQMNTPSGVPEGQLITVRNDGTFSIPFGVKEYPGSGSDLVLLYPGVSATFYITNNGLPGGAVSLVSQDMQRITVGQHLSKLNAHNNATTPTTKMDIGWGGQCVIGIGASVFQEGGTRWAQFATYTCDITVTGINGYDGNGALVAGDTITFYGISGGADYFSTFATLCSKSGVPVLPAGYTHVVPLFTCTLDASIHLPTIKINDNNIKTTSYLTAGSGNHLPDPGCKWMRVRIIGGGGGGAGSGTGGGNGTAGGNTTFQVPGVATMTANGGTGTNLQVGQGTGGTATNGDVNIPGCNGGQGSFGTQAPGAMGGNTFAGGGGAGAGPGGSTGSNGQNGGGGGGGSSAATANAGAGGGGGAYAERVWTPSGGTLAFWPSSSPFVVGAAGVGGAAGTGGAGGGNGGPGVIIVEEFFNRTGDNP